MLGGSGVVDLNLLLGHSALPLFYPQYSHPIDPCRRENNLLALLAQVASKLGQSVAFGRLLLAEFHACISNDQSAGMFKKS